MARRRACDGLACETAQQGKVVTCDRTVKQGAEARASNEYIKKKKKMKPRAGGVSK